MKEGRGRKEYRKPQVVSERVFEQAALSCVTAFIAGSTSQTLKIAWISTPAGGGCGYTSS